MAPLTVTPISLAETVKRIVVDPAKKQQLEEVQRDYAAGQLDKVQLKDAVAVIAGEDDLIAALRILVPGYDEMCGRSPLVPPVTATQPPAPVSTPALKKGFLKGSGPRTFAKAPASTPADPTPPPELDGADPALFREAFHQHMQEAMPAMSEKNRSHVLHNNFVMHDAKSAGAAGNVVLGADGRASVLSDEAMGGTAEGYTWGQSDSEVTLTVPAPAGTRSREVAFVATSRSLRLAVRGVLVVEGRLHAAILSDESTFALEDAAAGSAEGGRCVIVTLAKAAKTAGKGHWPRVVEGGPAIDVSRFGAECVAVDPNNPQELLQRMEQLQG